MLVKTVLACSASLLYAFGQTRKTGPLPGVCHMRGGLRHRRIADVHMHPLRGVRIDLQLHRSARRMPAHIGQSLLYHVIRNHADGLI